MSDIKVFNYRGELKMENIKVDKDVKFTLPLPKDLDDKIKSKAKKIGITKTAYIRMLCLKDVQE